jgi:hypothetical protein
LSAAFFSGLRPAFEVYRSYDSAFSSQALAGEGPSRASNTSRGFGEEIKAHIGNHECILSRKFVATPSF